MKKEKINLEARINRHLRVLKNAKILKNVWFESKTFSGSWKISYSFTVCLIFITFIFPIYPSISNIVYTNTETEFDRSIIDESSILSSFEWVPWEESVDNIEHIDTFITSLNTIDNADRDLEWIYDLLWYEVKNGDSIQSLAREFNVSVNTILWANNLESVRELKIWEIIKIPPTSGYLYKIKKWDKIENIASEYWISVEEIEKYNWIKNWYLIAWREIILPWASKIIPIVEKPKPVNLASENKTEKTVAKTENKPVATNNTKNTNTQKTTTKSTTTKTTTKASVSWEESSSRASLVWRQPKWRFAWGNCTWYVAQYKNVTWWWNANQWLRNARAKWAATWSVAKAWAIVQFTWGWYNPTYWHVWIVLEVKWDHMLISDMNYRRINEVTTRKVSLSDPAIDWFIYVD